MSFAGFVFDMIKRDKENRALRTLRRERHNDRWDKIYSQSKRKLPNTTPEELEEITRLTKEKEQLDGYHHIRMGLLLLLTSLIITLVILWIFVI